MNNIRVSFNWYCENKNVKITKNPIFVEIISQKRARVLLFLCTGINRTSVMYIV